MSMTTPRVTVPVDVVVACKGEQEHFETWAKMCRYDLSQHPLHYIFTDPKTDAARMGWKAALAHVHDAAEPLSAAPAPEGGAVKAWMFRESPSERWHVTMDRRSVEEYIKAFSTAEVHPLAIASREEAPAEAGELASQIAILRKAANSPTPDEDAGLTPESALKSAQAWRTIASNVVEAFDRAQPQAREDAQPVAVCDGVEQPAFEEWASKQGFDMHEHPLHYLFLDAKTDAARRAWKAGLEHAVGRMTTHPAPDALRAAVEALEPFARAADTLDGLWSEDDWRWNDSVRCGVTVRDIRRARQALSALQAGQKGGAA